MRRGSRRPPRPRTIAPLDTRTDLGRKLVANKPAGAPLVNKELAAALGVHRTTLYRWATNAQRRPGRPLADRSLADDVRGVLYGHAGNIAAAHRTLATGGRVTTSLSTFRRQVSAIPKPELVYALKGSAAMYQGTTTCLPAVPTHRNQVWQIDHRKLDFEVLPPRPATKPIRPWVTSVIDDATRVVLGYAISEQPNSSVAAAALAAAIAPHPTDANPFCGIPDSLLIDNGKDFVSEHFTQVALALGIVVLPCPPYAPQHKGKVERWHRTMDQLRFSGVPGDQKGPRRVDGALRQDGRELVTFESVPSLMEELLEAYHDKVHSALGCSPREAWERDTVVLRTIEPSALATLLQRREPRTVLRAGIHVSIAHTAQYYTAPELATRQGERVLIGYLPHDDRQVWVYTERDEFICVAHPQDRLTEAERVRFTRRRAQEVQEHRERARQARRAGRAYGSPLTGVGQEVVITATPAEDDPTPRARHGRRTVIRGQATPEALQLAFGAQPASSDDVVDGLRDPRRREDDAR